VAKYMIAGNYTSPGVKGVMSDGGSGRRDAVAKLAESLGGSLDTFYFAFGKDDFYVTVDLPGNEAAVAVAMAVNAAGATDTRTIVLLTPEEVDSAAKLSPTYRAPGG
jgi:uncharacterized protein with GYD domain